MRIAFLDPRQWDSHVGPAKLVWLYCITTMSLEDKIKATAKDAEGKLQAAAGELTGDDQLKAEGQAKQVQASLIDAAGDLKDKVSDAADAVGNALKGLADKG
jgi:uncharacterized protein YjbJ (UPF0337 family)